MYGLSPGLRTAHQLRQAAAAQPVANWGTVAAQLLAGALQGRDVRQQRDVDQALRAAWQWGRNEPPIPGGLAARDAPAGPPAAAAPQTEPPVVQKLLGRIFGSGSQPSSPVPTPPGGAPQPETPAVQNLLNQHQPQTGYRQVLANLNQLPGNWHANRLASGLMQQQWQQQAQDAQQRAQAERTFQYQQRGAQANFQRQKELAGDAFQRQKKLAGIQHGQQRALAALRFGHQQALSALRFGQQQALQGSAKAAQAQTAQFERGLKLYDRAEKHATELAPVHEARTNIVKLFTEPSPMGDRGAIFTVMKAFDPTSVVRESEQATAANAAGVPERVRSYFNQVLSGKVLSDTQRLDIAATRYACRDDPEEGRKLVQIFEGFLSHINVLRGHWQNRDISDDAGMQSTERGWAGIVHFLPFHLGPRRFGQQLNHIQQWDLWREIGPENYELVRIMADLPYGPEYPDPVPERTRYWRLIRQHPFHVEVAAAAAAIPRAVIPESVRGRARGAADFWPVLEPRPRSMEEMRARDLPYAPLVPVPEIVPDASLFPSSYAGSIPPGSASPSVAGSMDASAADLADIPAIQEMSQEEIKEDPETTASSMDGQQARAVTAITAAWPSYSMSHIPSNVPGAMDTTPIPSVEAWDDGIPPMPRRLQPQELEWEVLKWLPKEVRDVILNPPSASSDSWLSMYLCRPRAQQIREEEAWELYAELKILVDELIPVRGRPRPSGRGRIARG